MFILKYFYMKNKKHDDSICLLKESLERCHNCCVLLLFKLVLKHPASEKVAFWNQYVKYTKYENILNDTQSWLHSKKAASLCVKAAHVSTY